MKWFKRYSKRFFIVLLGLVAFMYLNNSSLFTKSRDETPWLLAHRGLAQTFPMEGVTGETLYSGENLRTRTSIFRKYNPFNGSSI